MQRGKQDGEESVKQHRLSKRIANSHMRAVRGLGPRVTKLQLRMQSRNILMHLGVGNAAKTGGFMFTMLLADSDTETP